MLVYDWMWWGQLTNQNLVQRCTGVHGGAQRCAEVRGGVRGSARRFFKEVVGKNIRILC